MRNNQEPNQESSQRSQLGIQHPLGIEDKAEEVNMAQISEKKEIKLQAQVENSGSLQQTMKNSTKLPEVAGVERNSDQAQSQRTQNNGNGSKNQSAVKQIESQRASSRLRLNDNLSANQSFTQKSLNEKQALIVTSEPLQLQSEVQPPPKQLSTRIKEATSENREGRISQSLYVQGAQPFGPVVGSTLSTIKGLKQNTIITEALPSNKLSPLPQKYQQQVANYAQKILEENIQTRAFNLNPLLNNLMHKDAQQKPGNKKKQHQRQPQRQMENPIRQDISYLNEQKLQAAMPHTNQPTILTSGNEGQDLLLEVTLGVKNLGKTLIHLPQTLEELQQILQTYESKDLMGDAIKYENDEKFLDSYLLENFSILGEVDDNNKIQSLPAVTRKQFQKSYAMQKKQPPFISTRPSQLVTIEEKIIQKYGEEAFLSQRPHEKSPKTKFKKRLQISVQEPEKSIHSMSNTYNKINQLPVSKSQAKMIENIINSTNQFSTLTLDVLPTDKRMQDQYDMTSLSPVHLKAHKQIQSHQTITQITANGSQTSLGNPSSRQDAILLILWFEKILHQIQTDFKSDQKEEQLFPLLQLVMNICVKELARQVSVQCNERGLILTKIFQSYARLIDLINTKHQNKRWQIKRDATDKLDRYITIQENQIKNCKTFIDECNAKMQIMKYEMEENTFRMGQGAALLTKFKKKCYNTSKDLNVANKRCKYLETENQELKNKIQELSEKFGEEVSEIDDDERRRLMLKIEMEEEKENEKNALEGEEEKENEEINEIPDREIIQEDDHGTDMKDFEKYLIQTFGEKIKDDETQTEKVIRKHMKLGVKPHKLGIMFDKETFTDQRMFQGTTSQIKIAVEPILQVPQEEPKPEDAASPDNLETDGSMADEEINDQDNDLNEEGEDFDGEDNENLSDLDENGQQIPDEDLNLAEMTEEELTKLFGAEQALEIMEKIRNNEEVKASDYKRIDKKRKRKRNRKGKKNEISIVEEYTNQILERIKQIITSDDLHKLQDVDPEFIEKLVKELKTTSKQIKIMNEEMKKKEKQTKYLFKQNKKNEQVLKITVDKVDNLEEDNYVLRELVNDLMKYVDESESTFTDIIKLADKDQMGSINMDELKKRMHGLTEKIQNTKQRAYQYLLEDDNRSVDLRSQNSFNQGKNMLSIDLQSNNEVEIGQIDETSLKNENEFSSFLEIKGPIQRSNVPLSEQDILKKRAQKRFQLFNIGNRKKSPPKKLGTHPSQNILRKQLEKDPNKLKDIMPRKMMLRVINQIYEERGHFENPHQVHTITLQVNTAVGQSRGGDKSQGQTQTSFNPSNPVEKVIEGPLLEWIYESFMQKYGLKNVAEKKFSQLIGSCIIHKDTLHRIRLFGRFIEVYDEYTPTDYNKYLDMVDQYVAQILNFKIDDELDSILLPVHRALDYYRAKFESKLTPQQFNQRFYKVFLLIFISQVEKMRVPVSLEDARIQKHLHTFREGIDLDQFAEFVLDTYAFIQQDKEQQIKDIYLAVDMNNAGMLSFNEFKMLMKVTHYKSNSQLWRMFEQYSTLGLDPNYPQELQMSIDQFTQLCLEKEYLNPKVQNTLQQSQNYEKDFSRLMKDLPNVVIKFKSRLEEVDKQDSPIFTELLENFQNNMKYPFSIRVGWFCYRVVNETLKRVYVKRKIQQFLPFDIKRLE